MNQRLRFASLLAVVILSAASSMLAAEATVAIGNFGPTGLEVTIEPGRGLKVLGTQPGSPAQGKFSAGQTITAINGKPSVPPQEGDVLFRDFKYLASFITDAEASDGQLRFSVQAPGEATPREVVLSIPVLGAYGKTAPFDCEKTRKIIRANADFITSVAGENGEKLAEHNLYNGWAILMLLSTGEDKDLDVVRKIYRHRMASFEGSDTGSHNWHNGLQGMAVCEYYLRTGDDSVMPLINAICESARKYMVQGGWSHWAKGINPQYTGGGLMNPAGTQVLTTLLLAKQCGAKVDDKTLDESLRFFYRFAGHGSNPYGDHRPENGYGSNNGRNEMLALSMQVASRAKNGEVYAMARDKLAVGALYDYPHLLQGHTGGMGALWYGTAAALAAEKRPEQYATRFEHVRWFYELSRRHNGAIGASGAARYDNEEFGFAVGLGLTAPLKTLQITGAPPSPHAKPFELPARPWGREADLAFLNIEGGPAYRGSDVAPHVEIQQIKDADEAALRRFASHPEHVYRETAADAIREKKLFGLIEELLKSDDPFARHTGCMAVNRFEPWSMRLGIGTRGRFSLAPEEFTPAMFDSLMAIITDPSQSLWNVDQALLSLAAAPTEKVASRLNDLTPWLEHPEWWLNEAAFIALTPAMKDAESLEKLVPALIPAMASNMHAKPRSVMDHMIRKALAEAPPAARPIVAGAYKKVYEATPSIPDPEPGVDLSGITSVALQGTLATLLATADKADIPAIAQLAVTRLKDMRARERDEQIDLLIAAGQGLDPAGKKQVGEILLKNYRPSVIGDDPATLLADMKSGKAIAPMNKLLAIDSMAGVAGGWQLLGNNASGEQEWWFTSFDPKEKPQDGEENRYRKIELPDTLANWYAPDYDPARNGWQMDKGKTFEGSAPEFYNQPQSWLKNHLPNAGEVVFVRKTFELDDIDQAMFRVTVYARQGYDVYLNGHRIGGNAGRSKSWAARQHYLDDEMRKHLKPGKNVIAATSFLQYFRGKVGGVHVYVEALKAFPSVE
jgi:hypothetical protein